MSDLPFGFGAQDRGDDPGDGDGDRDPMRPGENPFGFGGGPFGGGPFGALPGDLAGKLPLFEELQKLMNWSGGPVNWDLARQVALASLAQGHSVVSVGERAQIMDALRLADHWLDEATEMPSGITSPEAWSRVEWVERTLPVWSALCDPVAAHVAAAMSEGLPEQLRAQAGPMAGMMSQIGGMMFGAQIGQALGALAGEVLGTSDIGLPLAPAGAGALIPANVAAYGRGLSRPDDEVRLYLALREAAHQRLFAHVPWLRQRLLDSVDAYARGIVVDPSAIESALSNLDPTNPEAMQQALSGGLFEPETTPAQKAVLGRLETLLALIEGWVDTVVTAAAQDRLPGAEALREASRRRRASGGPAEHTFATLVGLDLRPRRLREASIMWNAKGELGGMSARDALWAHPDLLPGGEDLDDPVAFATRTTPTNIDEMVDEMLADLTAHVSDAAANRDDAGDPSDAASDTLDDGAADGEEGRGETDGSDDDGEDPGLQPA